MTSKAGSTRVRHANLVREALVLRGGRRTFKQIAAELDVTEGHASRLVNEGLDTVRDEIYGDADRLMAQELAALDLLYAAMLPRALKGDPSAAAEARQLRAQIERLLGLFAPEKIDVRGYHVVATREQALADGQARRAAMLPGPG